MAITAEDTTTEAIMEEDIVEAVEDTEAAVTTTNSLYKHSRCV
jgi:hypothetical protein